MTHIPLAGFYSIDQACAALTTKEKDIYPENLLRLVGDGTLTLYREIQEYLEDYTDDPNFSELDFSFGKHHFGSFELPEEWLNVIITSYENWRQGPQWSNMSPHFDYIHWFPPRLKVFGTDKEIRFDTEKYYYLEFPSSGHFHFHASDLNKLLGILPEPVKQARAAQMEIPTRDYVAALRILAETKAGPVPQNSVTKPYLSKLLDGQSKNQFGSKVSDSVQTWTSHLIKYHNTELKKLSERYKNNLCYLAVAIAGPLPELRPGMPVANEEWVTNLIEALPEEHQQRFTHKKWLEILKN